MKVPQSVTSWLYGKVGLYPGYFQVISWLYEFYKHTNVVISWLFSIYNEFVGEDIGEFTEIL